MRGEPRAEGEANGPGHERFSRLSDGCMLVVVDDVQLANYMAGTDPGPVEAWRVDDATSKALSVQTGTVVWISDYTLTKTAFVHPEIEFQDYVRLPEILSEGFMIQGNKKRSVEYCHADTTGPKFRLWCVSVRATLQSEAFITMIRRGNLKDVRRKYRRAIRHNSLLRDHHDVELARHLNGPRQGT